MRVILVGGGETVFFLARTYLSKGYHVSVINLNRGESEQMAKTLSKVLVICGDGTDPRFLRDARASEADLLLAVTPKDHVNLVCCQTATIQFGIPRTLAMISDPDNYEIYKKLGISHVFNQTELMVSMLEKNVSYDYLSHVITCAEGEAMINEILVSEKMPSVGIAVSELKLPIKSRIIGIERGGHFELANRETVIQAGDRVLLLTNPENHAPSLRVIAGTEV